MKKKKAFLSIFVSLFLMMTAFGSFDTYAAEGDIVILYTNDVHCGIEDNIGYSGLALYKKQMEAEYEHVTLIDSGDAIQGAPIGTLSDGGYLVEIMNEVGYDMVIPGNHEFDYGMDRFLELSKEMECGYYSCNLTDLRTGETVFEPYKLIDYGNVQVAYVAVTTPESLTKSTPDAFQNDNGEYIYGFCEDEDGTALYQAVQTAVDEAKKEGADYVIGVCHLGQNGSTERWTSQAVIEATTGIDAVIDGHSHEEMAETVVKNKAGEPVLLTQTGTKLANIGKLTIGKNGELQTELVSMVKSAEGEISYEVVSGDTLCRIAKRALGSYDRWVEIYEANSEAIHDPNLIYPGMKLTIPDSNLMDEEGNAKDTQMAAFMDEIKAEYEESLKVVLGRSAYDLTTLDLKTGERAIRNANTNLGDLCADAFRYTLKTDIGMMNGGGIRGDIAKGDITYHDTLVVFPYGNMICAVEATGQQIKDALELGAMYYPEESGGFLHVSGLTYTIDSAVKSTVETDDKGNFIKVSGDYRVKDIMVGEKPLDLNAIYTVASHNYMLKSGGDGMSMFAGCKIVLDDVMTDVDVLSSYINESLGGTVGKEYENPMGQGRILVK